MKSAILKWVLWSVGSFVVLFFYFWWINDLGQQHFEEGRNKDAPDKIILNSGWKFSAEDTPEGADPELNDSNWTTIRTDSLPEDYSGRPAWFRLRFGPSLLRTTQPFALRLDHFGASEIYLDGILLAKYGVVSAEAGKEVLMNPSLLPIHFTPDPRKMHVLAVRYSFTSFTDFSELIKDYPPGFKLSVSTATQAQLEDTSRRSTMLVTNIIAAFLATLSLIHFLLYLFYRRAGENLFFSIFALCYAAIFGLAGMSTWQTQPEITRWTDMALMALANPILFFSLLMFVYRVHGNGFPKIAWLAVLSAVLSLGYVLFGWFGMGIYSMSGVWLTVFTVISMILGTFRAIKNNKPGSRILGASIVLFALFIFGLLSLLFYGGNNGLHISVSHPIFSVILLILMLCVPISMSLYLAYNFSVTSRSLEKKLHEVEKLSAITIEQEKERQRILEGQKEMLEFQVKERTAEIVEQKKIIEEKNKDITDSILYAKRIQDSILPGPDLISATFPDCSVLFRPKDIVSGDFYWFGSRDNKHIAACADCTGHGVPGALLSMIGSNLLHQAILERGVTAPHLILNNIQQQFPLALKHSGAGEQSATRVQDGMDIAVIAYDPLAGTLEFAGAQRPLWKIREENLEEWKGDKIPISASGNQDTVYSLHRTDARKGDLFILSSDGYADQFGGKGPKTGGKKLMTKEFKNLMLSLSKNTTGKIAADLGREFEAWRGSLEQMDDVCVILIKI
ncbi:MAG: SpoIIE family protein phosphatase [Bacteroidia bacterium]|nr:SpoIIE family protein phosphatase [Bacteroidia bacterium]